MMTAKRLTKKVI